MYKVHFNYSYIYLIKVTITLQLLKNCNYIKLQLKNTITQCLNLDNYRSSDQRCANRVLYIRPALLAEPDFDAEH